MMAAPGATRPSASTEPAPGGESIAASREVSLSTEGMTCAAYAVRIEKKLNKLTDLSPIPSLVPSLRFAG